MRLRADPLLDAANMIKAQSSKEIQGVFGKDRLTFYAMDPAHISLAKIDILDKAYTEPYPEGTQFRISVDFIIDSVKPGTDIEMIIDGGMLTFKSGRSRRSMRLMASDDMNMVVPDLPLNATCMAASNDLKTVIGQKPVSALAGVEGEPGTRLEITSEGLRVVARNDTQEFEDVITGETMGTAVTHITPDYLTDITKALPKGIPVMISMGTDMPILYSIDTEIMSMTVLIAPLLADE